jgi:Zn-dependent M16 (insulinase) family peptidase
VPDNTIGPKEEQGEKKRLELLKKNLSEQEKETIVQDAYKLKQHQERVQDLSVLPSLSLNDISRSIEFVDYDVNFAGNKVKTWFFEQPTNGVTYVRVKASLKNLPEHLRVFVPMFSEFLSQIGTKSYKYDDFNDRILSCSNGLEVKVDKYSTHPTDIMDRSENLFVSIGFLDRNTDKAFECLSEIVATPNFDEPSNIADLVKMESINKANNIGNKGLEYARSYAESGIKAYARSFEALRSDVFFCQYAAEVLKTADPLPILKDAIVNMTEIASYLFREENLEFCVHGSKKRFDLIRLKLDMLLNQMKNENSRFSDKFPLVTSLEGEFTGGKPTYHSSFFKTPLAVNNCTESMLGAPNTNVDDYAALMVLGNLMTFTFLLPSIREKGGAYGAGCTASESGTFTFYSFRDPKIDQTYENFERSVS